MGFCIYLLLIYLWASLGVFYPLSFILFFVYFHSRHDVEIYCITFS